jgi:hypothetical protein
MVRGSGRYRIKAAVCTILLSASLAGCGSSTLLGPSDAPTVSAVPISAPQTQAAAPVSPSRIAVAAIMGAPDGVSKDVGSHLSTALGRQRVNVAGEGEAADYTLRGYMVATKEKAATKVSYIFDLTDASGKRVNRIQGEEQAQGAGSDPWAAVTPDLAQRITDKAATSLAASLSSLKSGNSTGNAPVGVGASSVAKGATVAGGEAIQTASLPADQAAAGGLSALAPAVSGAPGDGNSSLSAAMQQELRQSGIGAAAAGQKAYNVVGKVTVGTAKDGKQPIKIDWRVTDPSGGHLATVSQNNDIQAGALDGAWGVIASDAAQGAAAKIKALIEENKASAATGGSRAKTAAGSKT